MNNAERNTTLYEKILQQKKKYSDSRMTGTSGRAKDYSLREVKIAKNPSNITRMMGVDYANG